jgi:hypothetical protein
MSDQDPDPDPHWCGSLDQDSHLDKSWIRIRIDTNADPQHWNQVGYFDPFTPAVKRTILKEYQHR